MDKINQLSTGEKLVAGGGVLMLLASFFHWATISCGGFGVSAGEGGWGLSYALSKAGFHMIAPFLALEYGDRGIRAFNLQPGAILTERIVQDMGVFGFGADFGEPPQVIAEVVLWLATNPEANAMNGQCIQGQEFCHERNLLPGWSMPEPA